MTAVSGNQTNNSSSKPPYCYHCGAAIPEGVNFEVRVAGRNRKLCSRECRHTAAWIDEIGLADFYRLRSGPSARPTKNAGNDVWQADAAQQHVLRDKGNKKEVVLLVDGMHCAGCAWLIERALLQLGGVSDIQINPITHRAKLLFDPAKVGLPAILDTLTQAGYQPRPLESKAIDDARTKESRDLLKRLLVAGFGMMQVMTYAFVLYMDNIHKLPEGTEPLFRWLGFLVATPVVLYSALPFFHGARQALHLRALNMDVPIAIAIASVYGASVYQAMMFQGHVYFESATMLVFFLLTGRYFEMRARHRSVDSADALVRLKPDFAERRLDDGTLEKVAVSELAPADRIQVAEGAHVPADGQLLTSQALLDEALLSGESDPRQRAKGEPIIAGSLVLQGPIEILVTRTGADTFLSTLASLSTKAQAQRPKMVSQHQHATSRFVRRVLIFTVITLAGWLWYDPSQALEATIALLVVACPCALGLAAPAAITRALGVLARKNILVVRSDALDTLMQVDSAIFDKTGTLTTPSLDTANADPALLQLAASLARESQHPLSKALVDANQLPLLAVDDANSFSGLGLEGIIQGQRLRLGQARFVLTDQVIDPALESSLILGANGQQLASFRLNEILREDAHDSLNALSKAHISCHILSGDAIERVNKVASQLNIKHSLGRQQPSDKLAYIKQLQQQDKCVLAVGDGSNDAPVLAGANVSAALTSGAELAQANADILLCSGRLSGLLYAREIAAETRKVLRQNQRWAITYNTLAMPAAALGYIAPWLAAILMSASSFIVVVNALRIGAKTIQPNPQADITKGEDLAVAEDSSCCSSKAHSCCASDTPEQPMPAPTSSCGCNDKQEAS